DASRQVMEDILRYKLTGKLEYLARTTDRRQDLETLFSFGEEESYGDLGAYNGDTLREFLELTGGHYDHLYGVEPDPKNFAKLQKFVEEEQLGRCTLVPDGIWAQSAALPFAARGGRMSSLEQGGKKEVKVTCLDDLVGDRPLTCVKMDVEGVEKEALAGGARVIRRCRPKMLLAGYHHDDDLWEIPLEVWNLVPEYRIHLRRHPYVPCWEINFFVTL
ncbi:FkbM family methyltransferase, partial [Acidaminococcus fermentans]